MSAKHTARNEIGQTLMLVVDDFHRRLNLDFQARGAQGVGPRHRSIFLYLGRNGPSRAVDLAAAAGIRPQSMMKIVHELEDMGLIERQPDPDDSRAKLIDFTGAGRGLINELSRSTESVWLQYADIVGKRRLQETLDNLNTLILASEKDNE